MPDEPQPVSRRRREKTRDRTSEVLIATTEADGYSLLLQFKHKQAGGTYPEADQLILENSPLLGDDDRMFFAVICDDTGISLRPHQGYVSLPHLRIALELIDRKRQQINEAINK